MKFLIVDDYPVLRRGVKRVLGLEYPDASFMEAGDGEEAIKLITRERPDLTIMDLFMKRLTGYEVISRIRYFDEKSLILVFSAYHARNYVKTCIGLRADGFLAKDFKESELQDAVRTILSGKRYFCSTVAERMLTWNNEMLLPHEKLSPLDFSVLCMTARGLSSSEIGELLNLSRKTINTSSSRVFKTLGISSDAELIKYAINNELIV